MKISVTQKHIDEGRAFECLKCPIALAIKSQMPECWFVTVSLNLAVVTCRDDNIVVYNLPEMASKFVKAFDGFGPKHVEPFEFVMSIKDVR